MSEPQKFALPAGHIYVSRGLLVLLNDEAGLPELAAANGLPEQASLVAHQPIELAVWEVYPGARR